MKIGFITTINTNIGDDFIRTGIENILQSLINKRNIEYTYVNKHFPETAIRAGTLLHKLYNLPKFRGKRRIIKLLEPYLTPNSTVYNNQDLIIQSGAPVLWPNCHMNEWAVPIWYSTVGKLKGKVPTINLAAGSCYPWENQSGFINRFEKKYAKDIGEFCKMTTTRDKLAHKLFDSVGVDNKLMPCTAFFVDSSFGNEANGEYILINYMEGGGHFDWGQGIDSISWERTMYKVVEKLKKEHKVKFICHNEKEVKLAKKMCSELEVLFPQTVSEYLDCIKNAKLGINNRMHASVAMASMGIPAISVCTDTRLLMLDNLGLPIFYQKEASAEILIETAEDLLKKFYQERLRLFLLKKEKFEEYKKLIYPYIVDYV